MINKIIKATRIPELEDVVSKAGGGTWKMLYDLLHQTRLFKYVHKLQFRKINNLYYKVASDPKLKILCDKGYFISPQKNVYFATDKVLPILKKAGYTIETLPPTPKGKGEINELNNTEVFIKLFKEKHFYTLLYPNFGYLRPDALLVELDEENQKYKLTFIEVEAKKPIWNTYIKDKLQKYVTLSNDIVFYNEWKNYCKMIDLPEPTLEVKFNYKIIKLDD